MSKRVEFFYDFGSPASYLAHTQLPKIAEKTGAEIIHRPFLLGGVFKATGNSPPMSVAAKGTWLLNDLERYAKRYGVPLVFNPHFPINTVQLMRGATWTRENDLLPAYQDAMFKAVWEEARNMNDPEGRKKQNYKPSKQSAGDWKNCYQTAVIKVNLGYNCFCKRLQL